MLTKHDLRIIKMIYNQSPNTVIHLHKQLQPEP